MISGSDNDSLDMGELKRVNNLQNNERKITHNKKNLKSLPKIRNNPNKGRARVSELQSNNRDDPTFEKLDRFLSSLDWDLMYNNIAATALNRSFSDHVSLCLSSGQMTPLRKDFSMNFAGQKDKISNEGLWTTGEFRLKIKGVLRSGKRRLKE
jgi:hypothetical protein